MADLIYPNSIQLQEIAQILIPRLEQNRLGFTLFPTVNVDDWLLSWELYDNFQGLQAARGLNGEPPKVKRIGLKRYMMEPGAYGEFDTIDETEITRRRRIGTLGEAIDISELVMVAQRNLLQRRLDRIEWIIWTLLATGTFSVAGPNQSIIHTDTITLGSYAAGVSWATSATATPLHDFRQVQLKHRGQSVSFNRDAMAIMNLVTFNNLINNGNNLDLYGRRVAGLATVNSPEQLSQLLGMDNLPTFTVYDEGYLDTSGTFQPFIPDNKVIVIGKRTNGAPLGNFAFARNANNPGSAPGPYMKIVDNADRDVPRSVQVHDGFNGGIQLFYGTAIVVMSV
jgi:hypothetical protein